MIGFYIYLVGVLVYLLFVPKMVYNYHVKNDYDIEYTRTATKIMIFLSVVWFYVVFTYMISKIWDFSKKYLFQIGDFVLYKIVPNSKP